MSAPEKLLQSFQQCNKILDEVQRGLEDYLQLFKNHKNEKFGEEIFTEYIWLSKNPRVGYKLLATALKFAKEKEFKYVMMSRVMAHSKSDKVARFYRKMGFVKDSETYIAKL